MFIEELVKPDGKFVVSVKIVLIANNLMILYFEIIFFFAASGSSLKLCQIIIQKVLKLAINCVKKLATTTTSQSHKIGKKKTFPYYI